MNIVPVIKVRNLVDNAPLDLIGVVQNQLSHNITSNFELVLLQHIYHYYAHLHCAFVIATANIEKIKDIEFTLHIFDTESWDDIINTDTINIKTSIDDSYVQTYDDSGFKILDQNGIKVVVKKLDSEDSFWGADIYVYIENNGDDDITIQLRDVSVNGFMVDPAFSSDVLAGKKSFDSITFFESDLEDNGIEKIEDLEFYFKIINADNWNDIFESELVKVSFNQ